MTARETPGLGNIFGFFAVFFSFCKREMWTILWARPSPLWRKRSVITDPFSSITSCLSASPSARENSRNLMLSVFPVWRNCSVIEVDDEKWNYFDILKEMTQRWVSNSAIADCIEGVTYMSPFWNHILAKKCRFIHVRSQISWCVCSMYLCDISMASRYPCS